MVLNTHWSIYFGHNIKGLDPFCCVNPKKPVTNVRAPRQAKTDWLLRNAVAFYCHCRCCCLWHDTNHSRWHRRCWRGQWRWYPTDTTFGLQGHTHTYKNLCTLHTHTHSCCSRLNNKQLVVDVCRYRKNCWLYRNWSVNCIYDTVLWITSQTDKERGEMHIEWVEISWDGVVWILL